MSLQGKHALVTGGGTGIGLAIAKALAAEGAQVTITGRRLNVLEEAATEGLHPLAMDVAEEASVVEGVAAAVAARGPIQICVANAGIAEGRALHKTDMDFWRHMMAINIDGVFLTIRESLKSMAQTDWGRVMAVSSIAGLRGLKGAPAYSTSKHAVNGMIKSLAADFANKPITFNSLCPAYVETPIISQNIKSIMERTGCSEEEARHMMVGVNPHGRLITPEEVAHAALYLCSDMADSVRGQMVQISGGEL
ncbi:SDR family oxidoreductase [Shimia sp. R11_0]|uniref:3-oxoacyl-[acyl-carrier-protein] reductase FabG n=1 Tax=Shimia marina TaxID=321267 RepID=A0A0N7LS88_9RHOB|nr:MULTISPECIES: SDR family oxidoreductase [Shimia]MBO9477457.1 SDR family oxidoreductase [Shimia sp. R11_0]CUH52940.1 3-oxoacyl-[acyl-carrier-protein] reductase FabG [Shimia marina]SFD90684.1 NAD(P)-dependent dehydrogenase, short-chain alcohol dehydrogenase family [Shimia marina]